MRILKVFLIPAVLLIFLVAASSASRADQLDDLQKKINELQQKLAQTQGQERSLSSEIEKINNEISLTKLRIESTEEKLDRLNKDIISVGGKIDRLEQSLNEVSEALANRIVQTYIAGRSDPLLFLLSSEDFADFLQKFQYIQSAQKRDKSLMYRMAATKKNYHDQKDLLEGKKRQVEALSQQLRAYKIDLDRRNAERRSLLEVTRNDEKRYQSLINQAQQELNALRTSQFSGKREVKKGEVIGLMGNTGFSTGPHLHFGVYDLREDQASSFNYNSNSNNPFDFLTSRSLQVNSGACYEFSGVTNVGHGGWDWLMASPIISQCYGKTPYSFVYSNGRHEGVDMYDNSNTSVRAADDGVAYFYRGSSSFGNNVRIFHSNGKMTLYLHLQ